MHSNRTLVFKQLKDYDKTSASSISAAKFCVKLRLVLQCMLDLVIICFASYLAWQSEREREKERERERERARERQKQRERERERERQRETEGADLGSKSNYLVKHD